MSTFTVDQHFDSCADEVRLAYESILAAARELGPVEQDAKKTSIHLKRRTTFAGVRTTNSCLILTIKSQAELNGDRISRRERVSANRWHNEIRISGAADLDQTVMAWLKDSYELAG